jgi:hypothetical protein
LVAATGAVAGADVAASSDALVCELIVFMKAMIASMSLSFNCNVGMTPGYPLTIFASGWRIDSATSAPSFLMDFAPF